MGNAYYSLWDYDEVQPSEQIKRCRHELMGQIKKLDKDKFFKFHRYRYNKSKDNNK